MGVSLKEAVLRVFHKINMFVFMFMHTYIYFLTTLKSVC